MAKRGLGSADLATRQRVARLGGLARRKNRAIKTQIEEDPFAM